MLCTQCHTEYSQLRDLFMVYCCMCICMPSEHFMAVLFNLNKEEEEEFSLACCLVFRKLLNIVYLELLQKNSGKNIESFYGLVYMNFLSKPDVYDTIWISKLPRHMTMMGECSASILMDIIIQLFRRLFLNAIETLCDCIHSSNLAIDGTSVITNKEEDKEWHICKVQHFLAG